MLSAIIASILKLTFENYNFLILSHLHYELECHIFLLICTVKEKMHCSNVIFILCKIIIYTWIRSAAFSAMRITAELGGPDVDLGIMEASTTLRSSVPKTLTEK